MMKKLLAVALVLVGGLVAYLSLERAVKPAAENARVVDELVARNVVARGGGEAWRAVSSLRYSGRMDVGQDMTVPYVLEQKRPGKMRLEFVFDDQTAVQSSDGKTGWKLVPFRGRTRPEPMTEVELRETADAADLYGLLFDYAARGHTVELLGREPVAGRDTFKLKVTLPKGAVRWVYLDAETALEVKVEAMRTLHGRERRVETFYSEWQATDGLLIARRQETRTEGDKASHILTVKSVIVNPPLDDSHFAMPATAVGNDEGYRRTSL
jgi:outer membrane lipoprotein-sorting protein